MDQRYRIGSAITLTCLLFILILLEGCYSKPPLYGVHFPITSGSQTLLPSEQQRILIWGDPFLARVAEEWLRSHHYSNILLPPQIPHTSSDRQAALVVAAKLNAEFVLILEREELKEGALIESHCNSLYSINIDVRGFSVERQETVLRGNAHYPHCVGHNDETVQNLTAKPSPPPGDSVRQGNWRFPHTWYAQPARANPYRTIRSTHVNEKSSRERPGDCGEKIQGLPRQQENGVD